MNALHELQYENMILWFVIVLVGGVIVFKSLGDWFILGSLIVASLLMLYVQIRRYVLSNKRNQGEEKP